MVLCCFYFMCLASDHLGENIMKNELRRELDEQLVKNILSVAFTFECCLIGSKK